MQVLVLASLAILIIIEFFHPAPETIVWLDIIDITIGFVFLAEFMLRLHAARNRRRYLRRNWWLLLSTLPLTSGSAQALRLLRIAGHAAYASEAR
jgi:Ni,Fe-hydrogenase I cytochrome b subunit